MTAPEALGTERTDAPLPARLSEGAFQRTVIETAQWYRWRVTHFRAVKIRDGKWATPLEGDPGFPDLALARAGQVILAELKTNTGEPFDDQKLWLAELGVFGRVWRPRDWPAIRLELQHGPATMGTVEYLVRAFHVHFGLPIGDTSRTTNQLRARLIRQESQELIDAIDAYDAAPTLDNLHAVAHEGIDVLFAVIGTNLTLGIDTDKAARCVFQSLMTRQGTDETGKVVKGPNYAPPDMRSAIRRFQQ